MMHAMNIIDAMDVMDKVCRRIGIEPKHVHVSLSQASVVVLIDGATGEQLAEVDNALYWSLPVAIPVCVRASISMAPCQRVTALKVLEKDETSRFGGVCRHCGCVDEYPEQGSDGNVCCWKCAGR